MSMETTATRERPVMFSGPMVRAILDGRKTQTRRVLTLAHAAKLGLDHVGTEIVTADGPAWNGQIEGGSFPWTPYGQPGDRLWVRETWLPLDSDHYCDTTKPRDEFMPYYGRRNGVAYKADTDTDGDRIRQEYGYRWRPSIHMPRWASRLTLEVVSVRVERVQDISHVDAIAEGCRGTNWVSGSPYIAGPHTDDGELPAEEFHRLWDSINAARGFGWDKNPWCWVVEFKVVR